MEPERSEKDEAIALVRRIRNGEEQAYLDFQRGYRRPFLAVLLGLGIPPFEAEDLTESAITDIIVEKLQNWNSDLGSFDAWVSIVVRNRGLEWLRKTAKTRVVPLLENFLAPAKAEDVFDPARASAVHEAMLQLSVSDRIVLEMREFEDNRPYSEIAQVLSRNSCQPVSEGAARVRHKRALERLASVLRTDGRIRLRDSELSKGEHNEQIEERRAG